MTKEQHRSSDAKDGVESSGRSDKNGPGADRRAGQDSRFDDAEDDATLEFYQVASEAAAAPAENGVKVPPPPPQPPSEASQKKEKKENTRAGTPKATGAQDTRTPPPPSSSSDDAQARPSERQTTAPAPAPAGGGGANAGGGDYPMSGVKNPGKNDVLFGRGHGANTHPGNVRFRNLLKYHKMRYLAAWKAEKPKIAREVVAIWRVMNPPGRFLMRTEDPGHPSGGEKSGEKGGGGGSDKSGGGGGKKKKGTFAASAVWHDVGDKRAQEKTSQCLREKTADIMSKLRTEVGEMRQREILETIRRTHKSVKIGQLDTAALSRELTRMPHSELSHFDLMRAASGRNRGRAALQPAVGGVAASPNAENNSLDLLASVARASNPSDSQSQPQQPTAAKKRRMHEQYPPPGPGPALMPMHRQPYYGPPPPHAPPPPPGYPPHPMHAAVHGHGGAHPAPLDYGSACRSSALPHPPAPHHYHAAHHPHHGMYRGPPPLLPAAPAPYPSHSGAAGVPPQHAAPPYGGTYSAGGGAAPPTGGPTKEVREYA